MKWFWTLKWSEVILGMKKKWLQTLFLNTLMFSDQIKLAVTEVDC